MEKIGDLITEKEINISQQWDGFNTSQQTEYYASMILSNLGYDGLEMKSLNSRKKLEGVFI